MPRKAKSAAAKARAKKQYNIQRKINVKQEADGAKLDSSPKQEYTSTRLFAADESSTSNQSIQLDVTSPQCKLRKYDDASCGKKTTNSSNEWPALSTVSALPIECRMADVDQSDGQYGDSAGRQCMPTCYIAIAKFYVDNGCSSWSGNTIKELLFHGSIMYMDYKPSRHNYFMVDDLPRAFAYNSVKFQIENVEAVAGVIDSCLPISDESLTYVINNLTDVFEDIRRTGVLLTMCAYTTLILKDGQEYWILDTHCRDKQGRPNGNGRAGMFKFSDIFSIAKYVTQTATLLSSSNQGCIYEHYELVRIDLAPCLRSEHASGPAQSSTMSDNERCDTGIELSDVKMEKEDEIQTAPSSSVVMTTPLTMKIEPHSHDENIAPSTMDTPVRQYRNRYAKYYAENEAYRNKKRETMREKYKKDADCRDVKLLKSAEKYSTDAEHKAAKLLKSAEKYSTDAEHRAAKLLKSAEKYSTDAEHRAAKLLKSAEKYSTDADHRAVKLLKSAEKYSTDAEYRITKQEQSKQK